MTYEFGDVVLIRFPFTDQTGGKKRPAVVVHSRAYSREHRNVILLAVTTQPKPLAGVGEAAIGQWRRAGLRAPSVVKPVIGTFDEALIERKLGLLTSKDIDEVRRVLAEVIG